MTTPVKVKVCGITRPSDALLAARLGASYVGFVFVPRSPRYIAPPRAADIIASLPARVIPVGVFVDLPRDRVLDVISASGIKIAQFHGSESPAFCESFGGFPVIKAFRVRPPFGLEDVSPYHVDVHLLDAYHPKLAGGTGETFDWALAAPVAAKVRVMLSGGLTPENVTGAVEAVRPYAVDVSSGVEGAPGVKDPERMEAFFLNLERCGHHIVPPS